MVKFAIDCEMVGSGNRSLLARVSIVNAYGTIVLDEYVKPTAPVTDFRTAVSGIKRMDVENGKDFSVVQRQVEQLIRGSILIGHSLNYDLNALNLTHPAELQRDLAAYEPLFINGQPASLQFLAKHYLGKVIQSGQHDSVEDAKASMEIYQKVSSQWEKSY